MAKEIDYLELADILKLGREIIADFRVREIGLLESAVARPKTYVFGEDAYPIAFFKIFTNSSISI